MAGTPTITTFAGTAPPWSLSALDANFVNNTTLLASLNNYSNYYVDAGAANSYIITLTAGQTASLAAGLPIQFKAANANTGASTLNANATGVKNILNPDGSALTANQIVANGIVSVMYDGTQYQLLSISSSSGVVSSKIQGISASVTSSAMTVSASAALSLDFRSTTLGSGTISTVTGTPANLVIPSTATLGTVNAVASRIVVVVMNNAGTQEFAVVNITGGNILDEAGVISSTTIAGGSNTANVFYSTTGRSSLAYRVVAYLDSTQATAGTWATAPSVIQGYGGQNLIGILSRAAKAFAQWDGTAAGTITPRGQFNVTSVTKNATGDYTVNFTVAMQNANYSFCTSASYDASAATTASGYTSATRLTTSYRMIVSNSTNGVARDAGDVSLTIFGN